MAATPQNVPKPDSERSDDEKRSVGQDEEAVRNQPVVSLPPDPDAHLSAEEKAEVVSQIFNAIPSTVLTVELGSQTTMET